jgi:hypothetical protein
LEQAAEDAVAIGHFNISNLVLLKTVFAAASDLNVSVIVGASQERNFMFSLKKRRTAHDLLQERSGGFVAVFSVAVLLFVGIVIHLWVSASKEQGGGAIAWDAISVTRPGPVPIILAVFVAGFLWEFRRP